MRHVVSPETKEARKQLLRLPTKQFFEIPGRPSVVYQLVDYSSHAGYENNVPADERPPGAKQCRIELPFLFKAFESGLARPPARGSRQAEAPRASTIHEYLDWTVSAADAQQDDELSFAGFRLVVLYPRSRPSWPPPGVSYEHLREGTAAAGGLGAPRPAIPPLEPHGRAISAATIRAGPRFLEVPFVATQDTKKSRGFGRCLLEAVEDVARFLGKPTLMLCSTDDAKTLSIWSHLGFMRVEPEDWDRLQVSHCDLLYMENTVQMYKPVAPRQPLTALLLKHDSLWQRLYCWRPAEPCSPGAPNGRCLPPKASRPGKHRRRKRLTERRVKGRANGAGSALTGSTTPSK